MTVMLLALEEKTGEEKKNMLYILINILSVCPEYIISVVQHNKLLLALLSPTLMLSPFSSYNNSTLWVAMLFQLKLAVGERVLRYH